MAQVHLYVPEELHRRLDELPAEVSLSGIFQAGLRETLAEVAGCAHRRVVCADCGAPVRPGRRMASDSAA